MSTDGLAETVHAEAVVVDCHVDNPIRLVDLGHDLSSGAIAGWMDLERARRGNLTATFMACNVELEDLNRGVGPQRLEALVQSVLAFCSSHRDRVGLARSTDEVRELASSKKAAMILSIEGCQPFNGCLDEIERYARLGVASIGLNHMSTNDWADSSTGLPLHDGLSGLGREALEMINQLGLMFDVSHLSDKATLDAVSLSRAPIFASHSSARALVDHPRNLSDDLMRAIAGKGGVIGVVWFPIYISNAFNQSVQAVARSIRERLGPNADLSLSALRTVLREAGSQDNAVGSMYTPAKYNALMASGIALPRLSDVVDHIDHVVRVAGVDHVAFGTDHGAVNFEIQGLEDCSRLPALTRELLERGYSPEQVKKILGGNLLRFWDDVRGTV